MKGIRLAFPGPFDYEQGICLMKGLDKYDRLYGINLRQVFSERLGVARESGCWWRRILLSVPCRG